MSVLDKQYIIKLDLDRSTHNTNMEFSISDLETSDFWIEIKKSKKAIDFLNYNVELYISKPNGNIMTTTLAFDMEKKMHYCNLSSELKNILGDYSVQVIVNDYDEGERLVVPSKFTYTVVNDTLNDTYENIEEIENDIREVFDSLVFNIDKVANDLENFKDSNNSVNNKQNSRLSVVELANREQDSRLNEINELNVAQNNRLNAIETLNAKEENRLSAIEELNAVQDSRLTNIEEYNIRQDDRLNAIEELNNTQDIRLNDINEIDREQNSQIANLGDELDVLTSRVDNDKQECVQQINEIHDGLAVRDQTFKELDEIVALNVLDINTLEEQCAKIPTMEKQLQQYDFSAIEKRFTNIESKNTTQDTRLTSVERTNTSHANSMDTLRVTSSNQTIEINNLKNRVKALEDTIATLEALIKELGGN